MSDASAEKRVVILVEDEGWKALQPLTWLRPAADLVVGARTIRERWARAAGGDALALCRPHVAAIHSGRIATPPAAGAGKAAVLWTRDRWIPDSVWARHAIAGRATPSVWRLEGRVIAVLTTAPPPAGIEHGSDAFWDALARNATAESSPPGGVWLEGLPDLTREAPGFLTRDLEEILATTPPPHDVGDAQAFQPERIRIGDGCRIDRGAILDGRGGPVVLGAGSSVAPFTWIRGPFLCRQGCILLGGSIGGGTYLGPGCRVRGEVDSSTFLGHGNKAHDGFVGHSYIAEWVNLGALTTTSDLKNNYGAVHLEIDGKSVETNQMKVGSFIGDHAKTRIGTLLNSGSVIGLAANLFGDVSLFPKWVPDFAWGVGENAGEYAIDRCLKTAEVVMTRRGEHFTPALANALTAAFNESRPSRERASRRKG